MMAVADALHRLEPGRRTTTDRNPASELEGVVGGSVVSRPDPAGGPVLDTALRKETTMRVLFATDGSGDARAAAALLGRLPLGREVHVRIVTVVETLPGRLDLPALQDYYAAVTAGGEQIVEDARASLSMGVRAETAVLSGVPRDEIVREAHDGDADLVVMGARGLGVVDRWLLGSVSLSVARSVECAVLVAKGERRTFERAVVCLDGSDEAARAARFVAAWPLCAAHTVRLVGVVEPIHVPSTAPDMIRPQLDAAAREMKDERRAELRGALDQVAPLFETKGVRVSCETPEGHPADVITSMAAEPQTDLVVVGARGLGGVKRLLLGSVSENVLRGARCPVLIVKRPVSG
jgi:nucleotide-binding universal stress UspA family protein